MTEKVEINYYRYKEYILLVSFHSGVKSNKGCKGSEERPFTTALPLLYKTYYCIIILYTIQELVLHDKSSLLKCYYKGSRIMVIDYYKSKKLGKFFFFLGEWVVQKLPVQVFINTSLPLFSFFPLILIY